MPHPDDPRMTCGLCIETRKGLSGWSACEEHRNWQPAPAGTRIHAEDAPNPPDCVCRYKHCSDPRCRSAAPSQGAVRERDRAFPVIARHRCDEEDCWTYCSADRDGDCYSEKCPQIRDCEPLRSGRHCPLDRCFSERADGVRE